MKTTRHALARKLTATGAVFALGLGVTACDDGEAEDVVEDVEDGAEDMGDEVEDAGDEMEEEADE